MKWLGDPQFKHLREEDGPAAPAAAEANCWGGCGGWYCATG